MCWDTQASDPWYLSSIIACTGSISGWLFGKARGLFAKFGPDSGTGSHAVASDRSRNGRSTGHQSTGSKRGIDPSRSRQGDGSSSLSHHSKGADRSSHGGHSSKGAFGFGSNATRLPHIGNGASQAAPHIPPGQGIRGQRRKSLLSAANNWGNEGGSPETADSTLLMFKLHDGTHSQPLVSKVTADPRHAFPAILSAGTSPASVLRAARAAHLTGTISAQPIGTGRVRDPVAVGGARLAWAPTWREVVRSRRFDPEDIPDFPPTVEASMS